ncbi:CRISPR-associated helicase Cas3' [Streptomyces sp. RerS4]|uniref:CRISPR-associated helicase Cas3' n=1 Tax=Streptomyces sp. RerS4 TaxID=2942449 RepID=UPI00201CAB3F|nr:CRISPR-associated helicase Cas3' [Streptomyces sp. RerS4]UQW99099.1 CRISPR-associated helicase Cas3' [Streptomyces sp. RerS4]
MGADDLECEETVSKVATRPYRVGDPQPSAHPPQIPGHDASLSPAWLWLWAKTDRNGLSRHRGGPAWNSLLAHCLDTAAVCGELFDHYLALPARTRLTEAFGGGSTAKARQTLMLLVALHDMPGKATPANQLRFPKIRDRSLAAAGQDWRVAATANGLPLDGTHRPAPPHAHVTARYLPALLGCLCAHCTGDQHTPDARHTALHTVAALLGGHHGHIPDSGSIRAGETRLTPQWSGAHRDLLHELARLLDVDLTELPDLIRPARACVLPLFAGLVVHSDWIASDETRFTYRTPDTTGTDTDLWWERSRAEAATAIQELRLTRWQPAPLTWAEQMPTTPHPRPPQQAIIDAKITGQSLVIIEDVTGGGKCETAQYLMHRLALTAGYHGAYFALPMCAASEQVAGRLARYLPAVLPDSQNANLAVVHASAHASEIGQALAGAPHPADPGLTNLTTCDGIEPDEDPTVLLDAWYYQRCRGLLSCFGVGTVDQIVLAAQKSKHWFLRLYGLANKTVVIDEAHAYELYQQRLLGATIAWLADAGASVVVLSATLPPHQRHALVEAWCAGLRTQTSDPRPDGPITVVDDLGRCRTIVPRRGKSRTKHRTRIRLIADPGPQALATRLLTQHTTGVTTVILNTVARAEQLHQAVLDQAEKEGWTQEEILLLHGRYFERDRARHQASLEAKLGPHPDPELKATTANPARPHRLILIGTQVLEQSLDYDTDHLYTDLCPYDLIQQRRGRQWRHLLNRLGKQHLAPLTHVLWTPDASGLPRLPRVGEPAPYDPYILAATWHALHEHMPTHAPLTITSPTDVQRILTTIYTDPPPTGTTPIHRLLHSLHPHWLRRLREESAQAEHRELWPYPDGEPTTVLNLASGHSQGAGDDDNPLGARSRLGTPSIDIIGLYQHPNRVTWDPEGREEADLDHYHPYKDSTRYRHQRRQLILNTVRIPQYWIGPKGLPHPSTWTAPQGAALAKLPVLLLQPDGHPVDPQLAHLSYRPHTGLSRKTPPENG